MIFQKGKKVLRLQKISKFFNFLCKIGQENVFDNILERKKAFLDSKIIKISKQNLFDVIVESQKVFLDNKKQKFQKDEKSGFFQRGQSMVLVKNLKFSMLLFLARSTTKMCLTLLQKDKKRFYTIKKQKVKKVEKSGFFPRGLVHGLGKKFEFFFFFLLQAKEARKMFLLLFQKGKRRFQTLKSQS